MTIYRKLESSVNDPRKALSFMKNRIFSFWGSNDYSPFIIMTRSRTGSNLLVSLLNEHPNIFCEGEPLAWLRGRTMEGLLASYYGKQPTYIRAKGFKVFYYHPHDGYSGQALREVALNLNIRVIHLRRRNLVKVIISRMLAEKENKWFSFKFRNKPQTKIILSSEQLLAAINQTKEWEDASVRLFKNHRMFDLYYEDLLVDQTKALNNICSFLNCSDYGKNPQTRLKKQNSNVLVDVLENYNELKLHFEGTAIGAYFED